MGKGVVCQGKGVPGSVLESSACLREVLPCGRRQADEACGEARGLNPLTPYFRKEEVKSLLGIYLSKLWSCIANIGSPFTFSLPPMNAVTPSSFPQPCQQSR